MNWSVGQFGDARLDNSGAAMLEQMTVRKTVCLKRIGGARDGELRAGRFFGHENVTADKIIDGWGETTGAAAAGRHILAIQDTTKVKFKTTDGRGRGLGPVGKGNIYGLLAHVMIAPRLRRGRLWTPAHRLFWASLTAMCGTARAPSRRRIISGTWKTGNPAPRLRRGRLLAGHGVSGEAGAGTGRDGDPRLRRGRPWWRTVSPISMRNGLRSRNKASIF